MTFGAAWLFNWVALMANGYLFYCNWEYHRDLQRFQRTVIRQSNLLNATRQESTPP